MTTVLSTDRLSEACRIFARLAYPAGEESIPTAIRQLLGLPAGISILDCLASNMDLNDNCRVVRCKNGQPCGVLVRLGCDHYPHLKLKALYVENSDAGWLFSVDTHDAFSETCFLPPKEHPDAPAWKSLQRANVALKQSIEAAWEVAGLPTFNGLLRRQLDATPPSSE